MYHKKTIRTSVNHVRWVPKNQSTMWKGYQKKNKSTMWKGYQKKTSHACGKSTRKNGTTEWFKFITDYN